MSPKPNYFTALPLRPRHNVPVRPQSVVDDVLEIIGVSLLAFVLAVDAWLLMAM